MGHRIDEPLQAILSAKEDRALLRKDLAMKGFPSVSLSLNVPGFPKTNSIVRLFFKHCLSDLHYYLKAHLVKIIEKDSVETEDAAGNFFIVHFDPGLKSLVEIKQICENFEESHPLGRFVDVDVTDEFNQAISSGKSKLCFFCGTKPAVECRRLNSHDVEQVRSFMFNKMKGFCIGERENAISKRISTLGLQAILTEISLTPKPGLVDKFSSGSHSDMNYQTFVNSSAAISSGFSEFVRAGLAFHDNNFEATLPLIRNIGLRMETSMYDATNNVNTQKGIIFLMGLSLFGCGKLYRENDHFEIDDFRNVIRLICKDIVRKELTSEGDDSLSHGEDVFRKFGFGGARGEAESGFSTVFEYGLPQLMRVSTLSEEAMIKCFLAIASNNNDTNILYRKGPEVLAEFQRISKYALENFTAANYLKVIEFCREAKISPGGSADLLAVSSFIWSVMDADKREVFKTSKIDNDF